MRLLVLALAFALFAAGAHAQSYPAGVGFLGYKEAAKIKGCDSTKVVAGMGLEVLADGSFLAVTPAGDFTGTLAPLDTKGRLWEVSFDGDSSDAYFAYLEALATGLCGTVVTVPDAFGVIVLKLSKDWTKVSFQLRVLAVGTSGLGTSLWRHQIKAKGDFAPMPPP